VHGHFAGALVQQGNQPGIQFNEFVQAHPPGIAAALAGFAADRVKGLAQRAQFGEQLFFCGLQRLRDSTAAQLPDQPLSQYAAQA